MKAFITALLFLAWGVVQACEIDNAEKIQVGVSEGVTGQCSNNGQAITCNADQGGGWTCEGPQGRYNGLGGLTESLIDQACGC